MCTVVLTLWAPRRGGLVGGWWLYIPNARSVPRGQAINSARRVLLGHQASGALVQLQEALGIGEGQGSLMYGSPWGRKELDTTEQLN